MANPRNVTDRLIARAKLGEESAFVSLLARVGARLRRAIDAELEAVQHELDATQMWSEIQEKAKERLHEFEGTTGAEFEAWIERVALRHIRKSVRTHAGEIETVVKQPETAALAEHTHSTTSDPNATLAPHSRDTAAFDPNATIAPGDADTTISPERFAASGGDPHGTITDLAAIPPAPQTTKIFGDYEILETIARGGMGVVYKARQRKLNRIVALKMILAGQFADQTDIDRFYAEAEAAAHLRHPNIVGIHEVGECEGQHYFSMEYIEGQSLGDLVREHPLAPRTAAKFLKTISEAMHYAHQEGVLHRDLKPSNVLVDSDDVPLVTDFGLAKRAEGQSQLTVAGTVLGTPSYMPPEQASGKLDQISARSDVYSLGAILYELITGKPPFGAANPWETIKQVLGNEPVSPRLLNNGVPVDLETICLKCLQKDQDRRYQSAQDLADELHRFLVGEPILARRIGLVERSTRWCYRNPWPTAALGVLLLAVVGISAGLVRARVAEAKAKASETRAVEAKDEADAAKIQAETSRDQAMKTINEFITAWGDVTLLNEPGFEDVRAELLATASKLYKQMGERLGQDPKIQHELGVSYFRLGRMMAHLRSYDDAREALEAGLKIQRELHAARPHDEERLHALGETLNQLGNVLDVVSASPSDEAEQKFEQAVNLVEDTVEARIKQSFEQAEAIYDEAIEARTRLVDVSPDNLEYQRQLLNAHMNVGLLRRRMADVLRDQEQFETADAYYAEAHSRFEQVQQQRRELLERLDPTSDVRQELVQDLAQCYYNMAYVMWWLGDFDATGEHATDAVRAFDALLAEDPDRLENQYDQALCLMLGGDAESEQMGQLLDSGNDAARQEAYDAALAAYGKAIATLDRLASKSTSVPKYRRDLSQVYMRLGDLQLLAQQDQQALAAYQSAADKLQPLVAEFPAYQPLLDQANSNIAEAQQFINEAAGAPAPSAEGTE